LDFGIAARVHEDDELFMSSRFGTPQYTSPEQTDGSRRPGPPADVYSLGCVLYECLVGQPPHPGETLIDILTRRRMESVPPPSELRPELPPALDALILGMLAREPEERPADGHALAAALERVAAELETLPAAIRAAPPRMVQEQRLVTLAM